MKAKLACLAVCFLFISSLHGRIGETREEFVARYGEPGPSSKLGEDTLGYAKGPLIIVAHFFEGKCDYIYFSRIDKTDLSDVEIQTLCEANSGGQKWKRVGPETDGVTLWVTEDTKFASAFNRADKTLSIYTEAAFARKSNAAKKAALKGF